MTGVALDPVPRDAVLASRLLEPLPEFDRVERIFSDQELRIDVVDQCAIGIGGTKAFSPSDDAIIGLDLHQATAAAAPIPLGHAEGLLEFLDDAGYPAGSLHLREMTSWVSLLGATPDSPSHKRGAVDRLLRDFPGRRFLLVGDSGEHDPEIYAGIAREHGSRIAGIAIRDVTGEPAGASRWQVVFEGLPEDLWTVFKDGGDWRATP